MWFRVPSVLVCLAGLTLAGCVGPTPAVRPQAPQAADYERWTCAQIADEMDQLQRGAVAVAFSPGNFAGQGVLALGSGLSLYWPAMLAMRPSGMEARDLQLLKARFDALQAAAAPRCSAAAAPSDPGPSATAAIAPREGDRLVYEDRRNVRSAAVEWSLLAQQVSGNQTTYLGTSPALAAAAVSTATSPGGTWVLDRAGNAAAAPDGALWWPQLLRAELTLGQVTAGNIMLAGDPLARARMRGQIIAVGQQTLAGQRFDAAVVELFGDAPSGDAYTRVEGVIIVDRATGTLLRLDLRSAHPAFNLQRRLLRLQPAVR